MDITVDAAIAGVTVKELLRQHLGYSANMIKKLKFSENGILVDGRFVTVRHVLALGETLSLAVEDRADDVSPYTVPVELPISVIFEDEHMTVVNKPPSMPSHPSLGHQNDTVSNALAYRYREKNYVFRPVNRLDRDTSGCMLTANTRDAAYKLYCAMTQGRIEKTYLAVTDGVPSEREGTLSSYLRRVADSIVMREETSADDPQGKLAVTHYRVLLENGTNAVLLLQPVTGRTHQLRVQLSAVGCPITGDDMYGAASPLIARQALHSVKSIFPHPVSGERVEVTAPLYQDMSRLFCTLFGEDAEKTVFGELNEEIKESIR